MIIRVGKVIKQWQRLIDVELINPTQEIVNVVPIHSLFTDERKGSEYLALGTEVIVFIDKHNVAYAIGSTSQSIEIIPKLIKWLESEEIAIHSKNFKVGGFDGAEFGDFIQTKSMRYEILNIANDNLIDVLIEMCDAIALYPPATAKAVDARVKLEMFLAGEEAELTELEHTPHEF